MPRSFASKALSAVLVVASAHYLIVLCWLNTQGVALSEAAVKAVDATIVLIGVCFAIGSRSGAMAAPLLAITLNFLIIWLLSQNFDLKGIRDVLIALAFLWIGASVGSFAVARVAFFVVATSVAAFGLTEFLWPRLYVTSFDVLQFYIMRGEIDPEVSGWIDNSLFVSSMRDGGRNLLPFLGPHRVSSIFMEPVSMGNFGAIAIAWSLSLGRMHWRTALAGGMVGATAIVLADARFAAIAASVLVLARTFPVAWTRLLLAPAPFVAVAILLAFSAFFQPDGDNLPSRLAISGSAISDLSVADIFGMSPGGPETLDSGYAYVLKAFGLPLCLAMWLAFVWLPTPGPQSARLKLMIGVYACTLLCVSGSSLFALKTAALLWFLFGAMIAMEQPQAQATGQAAHARRSSRLDVQYA